MKNYLIIVVVLFCANNIFAQQAVGTPDQIAQFYKTKTCIVLSDDMFSSYNTIIKPAVEQNWTVTDYEFISMKEFNKRKKNKEYSFLIQVKIYSEKKPNLISYQFLSLLLGGSYSSINDMPELCSFPLSYYGAEEDRHAYKFGAFVLFIQNHLETTKNNKKLTSKNIIKYYNKNTEKISGKTLYVIKDELTSDANSLSKIKSVYKGKVEIVEAEKIAEAISNKDKNIIFLHKVGPPEDADEKAKERCYKMLMGAGDGKLYYTDRHKISPNNPDGFLLKDFKKLK